jgi:hypothetical protein
MSPVTLISLVAMPGSEPEPEPVRRVVALVPGSDERAAITLVSWYAPARRAVRH